MNKFMTLLFGAAAMFAFVAPVHSEPPGGQTAASAAQTSVSLSADQRAAIARELVAKFQDQVRRIRNGDLAAWSAKLSKVVATADSANVLRATTMPTLETMLAALNGRAPVIGTGPAPAAGGPIAPQLLGSTIADTVFTPLPNGRCRVADSRVIASPIPGGVTRNVDVEQVTSYASQGGNGTFANGDGSANCGIPSFVTSFAVSVTVLNPVASGFFKIFQNGTAFQTGNTVIFNVGIYGVASDVIVRSCQSCANELAIYSNAQVDYVIDVIGYFMPPEATALDCVNTTKTVLPIAPGGTGNSAGPNCAAGYTRTSTNCESSTWDMPFVYQSNGTCSAKNLGAGAANLSASSTCCRIFGR